MFEKICCVPVVIPTTYSCGSYFAPVTEETRPREGTYLEGDVQCPQCGAVSRRDEHGEERFGVCDECLALLEGDHVEAVTDALVEVAEEPTRKKARPFCSAAWKSGGTLNIAEVEGPDREALRAEDRARAKQLLLVQGH